MRERSPDKTVLPQVSRPSCLRSRFSNASCSRCRDICPHKAINLDDDLSIDSSLCSGCLLCSAVCPGGALRPELSLPATLKSLQRQIPIVIACSKATQECHLRTPCLGFIEDEFLLALFLVATNGVSLNLTGCSACVNSLVADRLKKRLVDLEIRSGLKIGEKIKLVECQKELVFQEEALDRRGFFRSLTRTIVSEAASLLATAEVEETERSVAYAEKQLPLARVLLKEVLEQRPQEERERLLALFCSRLLRSDSCDGCRACVKVCPTGALLENYDETEPPFEFNAANCTACGLCVEFCANGALLLTSS